MTSARAAKPVLSVPGARCRALVLLLCAAGAAAASLEPVGVLGNSGEAGPCLMRVDAAVASQGFSGVAVDGDRTLWLGAGTAVNHVSLNGALIESVPLQPAGSVIEASAFVLLAEHLYFVGRLPDRKRALFDLSLRRTTNGGLPAATAVAVNLPTIPDWDGYRVAAQPLNERLLLVVEEEATKPRSLAVYAWKPGTPAFARLFGVPGYAPNGIAVDPVHQWIYLGGRVSLANDVPGTGTRWAITAMNEKGERVSNSFPAVRPATMTGPVQYPAHVNVAGGALWDLAWYGHLARLTAGGDADPGTVEQWHHGLGRITQIVDVGDVIGKPIGVLACASQANNALFVGHWQPLSRRIDWVRRIGCLPTITSLGLTPEGWVTVGTESGQNWWRFEDAADLPPRRIELHISVTPLVQRGDRCLGLSALYALDDLKKNRPTPLAFTWESVPRNEAQRLADAVPLKLPVGLAVEAPTQDGTGWLFVSDADTRKIWRTKFWRPGLIPDNAQWQPLASADSATAEQLKNAGELAWLPDDTLLAAVEGALVFLKPAAAGYTTASRFDQWGERPGDRFGAHLRFAVSANRLLVADMDRHRVLLFDLAARTLLAQAGETDKAGDDLWHFSGPAQVAMAATRAVVADSGNQRVVKLTVAGD